MSASSVLAIEAILEGKGMMPTLTALRRRGAWFSKAEVSILPSNTAVGHSTISTGTDPRIHGVTGTNLWDTRNHRREDLFKGQNPEPLLALTLADLWSVATAGQAVILAQGSASRAATPLAGHGACQLNGAAVVLASYDFDEGRWKTNERCFRLPAYLKDLDARTLWADSPEWMGHRIDSASAVRYSALFPRFEAQAMAAMIEHEPVGADGIPDLILMDCEPAASRGSGAVIPSRPRVRLGSLVRRSTFFGEFVAASSRNGEVGDREPAA